MATNRARADSLRRAHIDNIGFQNFSVAHELGHYFLPGHIDAVLADGDVHESRAGFASGDRYEMEADHFAATLLMPRSVARRLPRGKRANAESPTPKTATLDPKHRGWTFDLRTGVRNNEA